MIRKYFGADAVRGPANQLLTPDVADVGPQASARHRRAGTHADSTLRRQSAGAPARIVVEDDDNVRLRAVVDEIRECLGRGLKDRALAA